MGLQIRQKLSSLGPLLACDAPSPTGSWPVRPPGRHLPAARRYPAGFVHLPVWPAATGERGVSVSKSARWALLVSSVAVIGAALVLAFVLSLSSTGLLAERHFVWLFWVNVGVAVLLALVIALAGLRLLTRLRRGKFGSRLLAKLAGIFALVGLLPGLLIYGVS